MKCVTQWGYWPLTLHPWTPIKWFEGGAQVERMRIDPDLTPPQVRGLGGCSGRACRFWPSDPSHVGHCIAWVDGMVASGFPPHITVHTSKNNMFILFSNLYFREWTDQRVAVCSSVTAHSQWVTVWTSDELWSVTRLESWQGMPINGMYNKYETALSTSVQSVGLNRVPTWLCVVTTEPPSSCHLCSCVIFWQTATPLPFIWSRWLLARWRFSLRNSLPHSLKVQAYLPFASVDPNLWNYDTSCPAGILKPSRFPAVVEDATVANVLPPARDLLLGRGAAMLKKSTETYVKIYKLINKSSLTNFINRCGVRCGKLSRCGSQEQACLWTTIPHPHHILHGNLKTYTINT